MKTHFHKPGCPGAGRGWVVSEPDICVKPQAAEQRALRRADCLRARSTVARDQGSGGCTRPET
eukprot:3818605-Rhodomonas_salina.1